MRPRSITETTAQEGHLTQRQASVYSWAFLEEKKKKKRGGLGVIEWRIYYRLRYGLGGRDELVKGFITIISRGMAIMNQGLLLYGLLGGWRET
jgi:hypothetical protein